MQLIKLSGTRKRSMKSALEFENIGEPEALWDHPKAVFFTICSWNYLGYAITLRESLIKTNGAIDFYAAICDDKDGFDGHSLSFPVILLDDLGIPSLEAMTKRYNITPKR